MRLATILQLRGTKEHAKKENQEAKVLISCIMEPLWDRLDDGHVVQYAVYRSSLPRTVLNYRYGRDHGYIAITAIARKCS